MTANVPVKFLYSKWQVNSNMLNMVSGDYSAKKDRQLSLNTY